MTNMGGASLPPGFRFHPTDEELVGYYLKRKVEGLEIELEVIPVIDLYKFDPWELPEKSFLPKRDMEWFFFCPRDRKYPNGSRTNRATKAGYWKATGKDRKVVCQSGSVTAYRKTLVFYCGRAPLGDRTDWIMHEYRLSDDFTQGAPSFHGGYALCRVVKKNENGQKLNDWLGEPKGKKIGSSSSNGGLILNEPLGINSGEASSHASRYSSPIMSPNEVTPVSDFEPSVTQTNPASFWVSPDLILDSSKDYPQLQAAIPDYFGQYECPSSSMTPWQSYHEHTEISPSSSYSNLNGGIELSDTSYMDFYGNEVMEFEGYGQTNSMTYMQPF
ncbi:hypothetical protein CsatB_004496 [Cannabis sativa]